MYFDNKYNYELITKELLNKLIKETQAKGLNLDSYMISSKLRNFF